MQYIVIDNFNGSINILAEDDDSGAPKVFNSAKEAQEYCNEQAQDGQVVPLGVNLLELMRRISGIMDYAAFELGEDASTLEVERQVNKIIDGYYPK